MEEEVLEKNQTSLEDIEETTEEIKEAMLYVAERNPAAIPYIEAYHLKRLTAGKPKKVVGAIKENIKYFF